MPSQGKIGRAAGKFHGAFFGEVERMWQGEKRFGAKQIGRSSVLLRLPCNLTSPPSKAPATRPPAELPCGITKGFSRKPRADDFFRNDRPKKLWLRPLNRNAGTASSDSPSIPATTAGGS